MLRDCGLVAHAWKAVVMRASDSFPPRCPFAKAAFLHRTGQEVSLL